MSWLPITGTALPVPCWPMSTVVPRIVQSRIKRTTLFTGAILGNSKKRLSRCYWMTQWRTDSCCGRLCLAFDLHHKEAQHGKFGLPAMTDFVEAFADLKKGAGDLQGVSVVEWSDNLAVGLARVVDVAILIPRILNTVAGSFKSVYADISVVGSAIKNFSPYGAIYNKLNGKSSNDEFQKDLDARNKVVEEANQDLSNLWNNPANMMEQSVSHRWHRCCSRLRALHTGYSTITVTCRT